MAVVEMNEEKRDLAQRRKGAKDVERMRLCRIQNGLLFVRHFDADFRVCRVLH